MFLESPHRGDSNEYTQHATINIKKKVTLNYPKYKMSAAIRFFSLGTEERVGKSVLNEPSEFEPLKFYCTHINI